MVRLIPRDERFLELFTADGENLVKAARALESMIVEYDRLDERVAEIRILEKAGDGIDAQINERLENAFITPFDRSDIHELSSRVDDILDGIQEVAETFVLYGIAAPTEEARSLGRILAASAAQLAIVLGKLEGLKGLEPHLRQVHDLEHEADGLSRAAIARLFGGGFEALEVIKWRDVYHALEEAIDAAEDAAEIVERMVHQAT